MLADPGGQGDNAPYAVNSSGQSVGSSQTVNSYEAVLWSSKASRRCFGPRRAKPAKPSPSTPPGRALDMLLPLTATSRCFGRRTGRRPCSQDAGSKNDSIPYAINVVGQSVGLSYTNLQLEQTDAVLWSSSGAATVLKDAGAQGSRRRRHQRVRSRASDMLQPGRVTRRSCGRTWGPRPCSKKWAAGFSAAPSPSTRRGKALGFL